MAHNPQAAALVAVLDRHAGWRALPGCAPLKAWQAADELAVWQSLEEALGHPVGAPFFALVWPAAQVMVQQVLSGAVPVAGRRVVDMGCGSGAVAVAAAHMGAAHVRAVDHDRLAVLAAMEMARRHGADVEVVCGDAVAQPQHTGDADLLLGADLFYSQDAASAGAVAVGQWVNQGRSVVLADGGRPFFDAAGLPCVHTATLPVAHSVEGVSARQVKVYRSGK